MSDTTIEAAEASTAPAPTLYAGTSIVKIDDKGRVFVPARYREALRQGPMIVFRGDHVALYDDFHFRAMVDRLSEMVDAAKLEREEMDLVLELSEPATIDSQGRLVVPKNMRVALGLEKGSVAMAGRKDHMAIMPSAVDSPDSADLLLAKAAQLTSIKRKARI